ISLWKEGDNSFLPDSDDPQRPSQLGLWAIGGIIEHLRALTAVTASTVNSYRRLWDTGFWAPVFADWGYQNRTTALRVSAPGRFEYRSVDSAVNPYLSMAALITAMRDGIERKLDPGEPEERNIYEAMEAGKQGKKIPMNFGPDSTGYALYHSNGNGDLILRYKLADANEPRDFEFVDRLARKRREVEARLADLGAEVAELEGATEYAFRARLHYDGELKALTD